VNVVSAAWLAGLLTCKLTVSGCADALTAISTSSCVELTRLDASTWIAADVDDA
jgi:hypothetical protein